jgi:perosamine synthetase
MIPVARPSLGQEEVDAAGRAILSGWVTQGPEVAAFEREFAEFVGAPHACAVSSCTVALHLALKAVGVGVGDEVITASHSFIATANAVRYCQATPVFVDIDPRTFNLDAGAIEAAITPHTRAILCVHQIGMPCDLAAILKVARKHRIAVVEDAACAIGSSILWEGRWERIGRPHGDIACFSFHPRKLLTTGDGGMLTTSNPEWDAKFRLWRQHGMTVPDTVRHKATAVTFESYSEVGYNYRMTDIQAAVGREQLKRLPELLETRRRQAERYHSRLAGIAGLVLPDEPRRLRTNWQSYCVRLPEQADQRAVMQHMLDAGIATRRGVMCAHREPAYAKTPWRAAGSLLHSEEAQDHGLILPLYAQMSEADQDRVVEALEVAIRTSMQEARLSRATD